MKHPHSVPLWRTNEELLPGDIHSRVILSSIRTRWKNVLLEQHRLPSSELADLSYKRHVVVINLGHSSTWEFKKEGRFRRFFKAKRRSLGLPEIAVVVGKDGQHDGLAVLDRR